MRFGYKTRGDGTTGKLEHASADLSQIHSFQRESDFALLRVKAGALCAA